MPRAYNAVRERSLNYMCARQEKTTDVAAAPKEAVEARMTRRCTRRAAAAPRAACG